MGGHWTQTRYVVLIESIVKVGSILALGGVGMWVRLVEVPLRRVNQMEGCTIIKEQGDQDRDRPYHQEGFTLYLRQDIMALFDSCTLSHLVGEGFCSVFFKLVALVLNLMVM